jgi:hypothetical protein
MARGAVRVRRPNGSRHCCGYATSVQSAESAGGGITVQLHGRSQVFVEARYHDLLGASIQPSWLVPLMFGIKL